MKPRADALFLEQFREHAGTYTNPPCGCSLDGPDRDCDVGHALFRVGTRNGDPVSSGCFLREMVNPPHPRASHR